MTKVLIAEDERPIARLLEMNLTRAGYICTLAPDGLTAADLIEKNDYDLALLDIMLPGLDGYALLDYLRPQGVPVIFLTAKAAVKDRVLGLRLGADDYIVKPFAMDELMARMEMVLRRAGKGGHQLQAFDVTLDSAAHTVTRGGRDIKLTAKEFALLEYMVRNRGVVLSREMIENNLWNYDYEGGTNVVDVYVGYLRKKVDAGAEKKLIHTVWGTGWVLKEE